MDGNGRWARQRGEKRSAGHEAGAKQVDAITTECARIGIRQLTLYTFSVENWRRPKSEVAALMRLLVRYLRREQSTMMENNIKFRAIGRLSDLPGGALREIRKSEEITSDNSGMTLCLALSYGGRTELTEAARTIARKAKAGEIKPDDITEQTFAEALYTAGMPDPDLLIRTAGEMRISNFLPWQTAYTEFYFTHVLWPDFGPAELHKAIREYAGRERKFGEVRPTEKTRGN